VLCVNKLLRKAKVIELMTRVLIDGVLQYRGWTKL